MATNTTTTGTDFHLPDEILSVIPTDPYDQLDLARKITSMAIASRVSKLESETSRLKQKISEKDHLLCQLQEKVSKLERDCEEADSRFRVVVAENVKLSKERDSLAVTVKKLTRDLSKLETFKRQLMQSLSDDSSSAETVDIGTVDQRNATAYSVKDLKHVGHNNSLTTYITPRFTPTETPTVISKGGSPRGYYATGSPNTTSGATSPTKPFEGRIAYSPWNSSSQQSSAAGSPRRSRPLSGSTPLQVLDLQRTKFPRHKFFFSDIFLLLIEYILGSTPRIDGKEFFRQARSRLSFEQFSAFLATIKEFNSQKQSREDTLRKAEEIFGTENRDLYLSFQGLLNRNPH